MNVTRALRITLLYFPLFLFTACPLKSLDDVEQSSPKCGSGEEPVTLALDRDGDGVGSEHHGFCLRADAEIPRGYVSNLAVFDCDDENKEISAEKTFYYDQDGDGYGSAKMGKQFCLTKPPSEYALSGADENDGDASVTPLDNDGDGVPNDTDCSPSDATTHTLITFEFRDADGDGQYIARSGSLCTNGGLPPGYLVAAPSMERDCDDENAAVYSATGYTDQDGDGWGTPNSAVPGLCNNNSQYVYNKRDCDDSDVLVGTFKDIRSENRYKYDRVGNLSQCNNKIEMKTVCRDGVDSTTDATDYPYSTCSYVAPMQVSCTVGGFGGGGVPQCSVRCLSGMAKTRNVAPLGVTGVNFYSVFMVYDSKGRGLYYNGGNCDNRTSSSQTCTFECMQYPY